MRFRGSYAEKNASYRLFSESTHICVRVFMTYEFGGTSDVIQARLYCGQANGRSVWFVWQNVSFTMISAFAHQLSELEKKIREQGSQIYQIYSKLQDDTNDTNSQADSDCKQLLDCLQSQIKHNSFKLNELHSKVVQHDVDIGGLKAAVTCDGHHQKLAANTAYNPLAIEFQPRLAVMPDTQTDFASGGVITSLAKEHRRPASAPYFTGSYDANPDHGQSQDSPGTFGIFPPPDMFPPLSDHDQVSFSRDVDAASPRDLSQGDRDTELMLLKEELSYCKGRVHELEMELENKNHIIRSVSRPRDVRCVMSRVTFTFIPFGSIVTSLFVTL